MSEWRYLTEDESLSYKSNLPAQCCAKCRFWDEHEDPTTNEEDHALGLGLLATHTGFCRRHAPSADTSSDAGEVDYVFPTTWGHVWCGDYGGRDGTEAT